MSTDQGLSKEERILRVMRTVLTRIARETAVPPGTIHPLSIETIDEMRNCLALISARERELAEDAGRPSTARPQYVDQTRKQVFPLSRMDKKGPVKDR